MAYTPTNWQDGVTPVNAVNMNKLEQGLAAAVGIPADVVVTPASSLLIRNRFNAADTQPAFKLQADGRLDWGAGGSTAPDTNLYRKYVHGLATDANFYATGFFSETENPDDFTLAAWTTPDPYDRFDIQTDGKMRWGDGASVPTVNLYRASGTLRTDTGFWINGGQFTMLGSYLYSAAILGLDRGPTNLAVEIYQTPDTDSKMVIRGDGKHEWGTGMAAKDTNLYRVQANMLGTDSGFFVGGQFQTNGIIGMGASSFLYSGSSPLGNGVVLARAPGDVDNRFTLSNDGHMYFGGGAAGPDTQLYRAGVGVLQTDTLFKSAQDIWSRAGAAQQVVIGNMGGAAGIYFSNLADVTLFRAGAASLQTNAEMQAQGFRSLASATGAVAFVTSSLPADGSGYLIISQQTGDAHWRVLVNAGGYITWGDGANPGDTALYRSGAGALTTGGSFIVGAGLYVGTGAVIDNGNTGQKLFFGSALDTSLYRSAAGLLRTDGGILVGNDVRVREGTAYQTKIGYIDGPNAAGIGFGSAGVPDTNLYRAAAGVLKTDGQIWAVGDIYAWYGSANQVRIGNSSSQPSIAFGSSLDTVISRAQAGVIAVNGVTVQRHIAGMVTGSTGAIVAGGGFTVNRTGAGQYTITFTQAFAVAPVVVCSPSRNGMCFVFPSGAASTTTVNIIARGTGGAVEDDDFSFIASGY